MGPLSTEEVVQWCALGIIQPGTLMRNGGFPHFLPVRGGKGGVEVGLNGVPHGADEVRKERKNEEIEESNGVPHGADEVRKKRKERRNDVVGEERGGGGQKCVNAWDLGF